jgi:hypothetical protein
MRQEFKSLTKIPDLRDFSQVRNVVKKSLTRQKNVI